MGCCTLSLHRTTLPQLLRHQPEDPHDRIAVIRQKNQENDRIYPEAQGDGPDLRLGCGLWISGLFCWSYNDREIIQCPGEHRESF
jgi:hypothetical protein